MDTWRFKMPDFTSIILPPDRNVQFLSSFITTLQKIAFIFYLKVGFYDGTIFNFFNYYLTPVKTQSWFNSWTSSLPSSLDKCKYGPSVILDYRCMKTLLIVDDSEIHRAIADMRPFTKWQYLMIVRGCKTLAPFLLQMCLVVMLIVMGAFLFSVTKRLLSAFGIRIPLEGSILSRAIRAGKSFATGFNLAVIPGFLLTSYITCVLIPQSNKGYGVCRDNTCLYCINSLSKTIFSDLSRGDVISPENRLYHLFPAVTYLATAALTVAIYYFTILFLSLVVFLPLDAIKSVWKAGCAGIVFVKNSMPGSSTLNNSLGHMYMQNLLS